MLNFTNKRINRNALFSDQTGDYRIPEEPNSGDKVVLRFRTGKNDATRVKYIEEDTTVKIDMKKVKTDRLFDYYECEMLMDHSVRRYHFQVSNESETCYYNRVGVTDYVCPEWAFRISPDFHTPEWAKGAVMYQIFVDRFCNGDKKNDVQTGEYFYIGQQVKAVEQWETPPTAMDVGHFYGGDLQGVWDKLDYLQYLGVEVIYFNPVFVSPSNHKYDSQDYDYIDPHYGVIVEDGGENLRKNETDNTKATKYQIRVGNRANLEASNEFFAKLVTEIHKRGMKVIIDGVFNHCGSFNKWLDRELIYKSQGDYESGAYEDKDSPYHTFFRFNDKNAWPCNGSYDGWWGHDTLPKLNYEESEKLYDYIIQIAKKWVKPPFEVDGWRLDVAADLGHSSEFNHKFWKKFRNAVKTSNKDAIIIAEHYGDASSWLQGDEWDTIMNYDAFMEPITWFFTGMEKHSDEQNDTLYGDGATFFQTMMYFMSRMQQQSLSIAMNQLSNHDHSRFLTRTNKVVGRIATMGTQRASEDVNYGIYRAAVMVQMTWPGAPTLYYGDETGVCGWTDPDNRRTYPWSNQDFELIEFHKYMIGFHKGLMALKKGSLKPLVGEYQIIAYGRMYNTSVCVVGINNDSRSRELRIPVWEVGVYDGDYLQRIMLSYKEGYNVGQIKYLVEKGYVTIQMPPFSGVLLKSTCNVSNGVIE